MGNACSSTPVACAYFVSHHLYRISIFGYSCAVKLSIPHELLTGVTEKVTRINLLTLADTKSGLQFRSYSEGVLTQHHVIVYIPGNNNNKNK